PRIEVAKLACEALGWIGTGERATASLMRYLYAEQDEERAAFAGVALVRLGDEDAADLVFLHPFYNGVGHRTFHEQVQRAAAAPAARRTRESSSPPPRTAREHLRRGVRLLQRRKLDEAATELDRAIELDPALTDTWGQR